MSSLTILSIASMARLDFAVLGLVMIFKHVINPFVSKPQKKIARKKRHKKCQIFFRILGKVGWAKVAGTTLENVDAMLIGAGMHREYLSYWDICAPRPFLPARSWSSMHHAHKRNKALRVPSNVAVSPFVQSLLTQKAFDGISPY